MANDKCDVPHCTNRAYITKEADGYPFRVRTCREHAEVWRPEFVLLPAVDPLPRPVDPPPRPVFDPLPRPVDPPPRPVFDPVTH